MALRLTETSGSDIVLASYKDTRKGIVFRLRNHQVRDRKAEKVGTGTSVCMWLSIMSVIHEEV